MEYLEVFNCLQNVIMWIELQNLKPFDFEQIIEFFQSNN